jgi:6-phosphogluconolactonase/glucosamine-6-phosphate isomerase/deaminase
MARLNIKNFEKIIKERNNIHEYVSSKYCSFVVNNERYLQIDTYGSNEREFKDKISQSIQIDKEMAEKLINIFKNEFGI